MTGETMRIDDMTGEDSAPYLTALAELRIAVFREYPYLYAGSLDYERSYLATYASSPDSLIVVAREGTRVIGASTAMPLTVHGDDVSQALVRAGYDAARVCYFGESVLERPYRGRGIGTAFFENRERHARARGFNIAAFCAVQRPVDHPQRPVGYLPLDAWWGRRGFRVHPEITTEMFWPDAGDAEDSAKTMMFWIKELT